MAGHDRITAQGRRFFAELERLRRLQVRVGFEQGQAFSEEGVDMVDIAAWNEVGNVHTPARPFLRKSVDENEARINSFCQQQFRELTVGRISSQSVLSRIGAMQVGLVQEKITDGDYVPNSQSTVQKKGSDKPLIDTGRMRQSVHFVIELKED